MAVTEVTKALRKAAPAMSAEQAETIAKKLIEESWVPDLIPLKARLNAHNEMARMSPGGVGGGLSIKLKNVRLKLWKLGEFAAGGALALLTVGTNPILLTLAVVSVAFAGRNVMSLHLSEVDASVLWAASLLSPGIPVPDQQLFERSNKERSNVSMLPLDYSVFSAAVLRLVEAGCFDRVGIASIRLVEAIEISS